MPNELTELRNEVAQLRAELKDLRLDFRELLRKVGITPGRSRDKWEKYLALEVESLEVRHAGQAASPAVVIKAGKGSAHLWLVDENDHERAAISVDKSGARIDLKSAEERPIVSLSEIRKNEPQLYLARANGKPALGMQIKEGRAILSLTDEKNRALVLAHENESGGELLVGNRNGKTAVAAKATDRGGLVTVDEPSGQVMAFITGSSECGTMAVYGPQGAMAASVSATDEGGAVLLLDAEGETKAHYP